jgi:hypothetical protein
MATQRNRDWQRVAPKIEHCVEPSNMDLYSWTGIVTWLYGASGVAVVASYVPLLRAILRSDNARAISLVTCGLWCAVAFVSALYATTAIRDSGMLLMALGNLGGSAAVTLATLWRRRSALVNSTRVCARAVIGP